MNIFRKFFQFLQQKGQGYHINYENQFGKFWLHGPFRVTGHIYL